MAKITLNLISGRTIHQGVAMEGGKEKELEMQCVFIVFKMNLNTLSKEWGGVSSKINNKLLFTKS